MLVSISPQILRGAVGLCLCVLFAGPAAAVELSIRNDMRKDDAAPMLYIEDARSFESPKSRFRASVHPGKTVRVTKGNVSTLRVVRPFTRHKLKYDISCEEESPDKITITLMQIHNRKLPSACKVERIGHYSQRTGMHWKHGAPKPDKRR